MKIFVKAKPTAKENKVEKIDDFHFTVSVTEIPRQGKANQAIIKILADYFKVSSQSVKIVSGYTSRQKIIEITREAKYRVLNPLISALVRPDRGRDLARLIINYNPCPLSKRKFGRNILRTSNLERRNSILDWLILILKKETL